MWDDLQSREVSDKPDDQVIATPPRKNTESAIFDETVTAYTTRRKAAEDLLISALANDHAKAFRSYTQKVQWTTIGDAAVLGMSSTLVSVIAASLFTRFCLLLPPFENVSILT